MRRGGWPGYRTVDAGGAFGLVDEPAFRAMNPNGRVPVIEDDGSVLWESNAIVRYLAARYAPGDLYPQDPVPRRRRRQVDGLDHLDSRRAVPRPVLGTLRTPPEQRDEALIAKALQTCGELLRVPDQTLAGQPWLSGERFGMGDIPWAVSSTPGSRCPSSARRCPHLEAWYLRLRERPAFRTAVMTELT
ncbi:glutathione S-transferase family protein [Pseudomonas aeruginosa]|nr:glutathione S-transferase family protein [Pseudomonas aeruginosa]